MNRTPKAKDPHSSRRHALAYVVLIFSTISITALAIYTIANDPDEAKDIFNVVLPVFSSWVGTILAFYFGRESFESANQQVRELVEKLAPEERAQSKVSAIMRPLRDTTFFSIQQQSPSDIQISELRDTFNSGSSRLPILDHESKPLYMIHESMINQYIASGNDANNSLQDLIEWQANRGLGFGVGAGFVIVSEEATIAEAKRLMESISSCQDIFVTADGTPNSRCVGWISNVRLAKFLTT